MAEVPLPDQGSFIGYIPADLYNEFLVNKHYYDEQNREYPWHYSQIQGYSFKVWYGDPWTAYFIDYIPVEPPVPGDGSGGSGTGGSGDGSGGGGTGGSGGGGTGGSGDGSGGGGTGGSGGGGTGGSGDGIFTGCLIPIAVLILAAIGVILLT